MPGGSRVTRKRCNWARTRARHVSRPQEVVRIDSRRPQYSAERPFRHVAWMIRHGCITMRGLQQISPRPQLPDDLPVPEPCEGPISRRPLWCSLAVHWLSASSERRRAHAGLRSVSGLRRARFPALPQRSGPVPPGRKFIRGRQLQAFRQFLDLYLNRQFHQIDLTPRTPAADSPRESAAHPWN
jgi:hypothetical protein